ncbi:MAG: hypothetical protein UW69_C0075G0002 [Microgenomates group bacterium GW2011_GWA2_44_7]|nr:MAG: hypothetical protein UW69_C0075G0002 [Microgenomates group bacterium GW2011_GWA2_44_7]KKT77308.1 MAG: hypothetical protein UW73_C0023G0013 [Microgenomates group bacterium GW2011_GWB1_44_8]
MKQHIQLQGWTIDSYLKLKGNTLKKAQSFIHNLKIAAANNQIRVGFSAYSHPILPFLSDEVIKRELLEDYQVVERNIGKPAWFWPPEGAIDQRVLSIVHSLFPDTQIVISDKCLDEPIASGFYHIAQKGVIVSSVYLKDLFMNAGVYPDKPKYIPPHIEWEKIRDITTNKEALSQGFHLFGMHQIAILTRDMENAGSKEGLFEFKDGHKQVKALQELAHEHTFVHHDDEQFFREGIDIKKIKGGSWEPKATFKKPYPYWNISSWKNFVEVFCSIYQPDFPTETLAVLASDVPWHYLAPKEWNPNPGYSADFVSLVMTPLVRKIDDKRLTDAFTLMTQDFKKGF